MIDWGAMQFLELGRQARRRIRLTELLLMLARMALARVVALALARPFWSRQARCAAAWPSGLALGYERAAARRRPRARRLREHGAEERRRDRAPGRGVGPDDSSADVARAIRSPCWWPATAFAADRPAGLRPGQGGRCSRRSIRTPRGASDLPAALVEAFRILERTENPGAM